MSGYIMRVTTRETSGPSGAGSRAAANRNPRLDNKLRLAAPERREPARSGWCLTRLHEACVWSGCACSCHYGTEGD